MDAKENNANLSVPLGEFADRELEKEFINFEISSALKYLRPAILILSFMFFLFVIPDYFLTQSKITFYAILIARATFWVTGVLLILGIKRLKDYTALSSRLTAYQVMACLVFLFINYIYESPNFYIQSYGVITIILAIFFMPTRWINKVYVSVGFSFAFFIVAAYHHNVQISDILAGVVYVLLVVVLSSVSSYRIDYLKRIQYLNSKELIKLSATDPLTGIYNRAKFNEEFEKWFRICKRYKTALSLVIFDLDDFKVINDNYGHLVGDKVLIEVTKIVIQEIRKTDIFVRWGGDEFMILLPNTENRQAILLTERIRKSISDHVFDERVGHVNCSFGVVTLHAEDNMETFINRADKMLYEAKNAGKNVVKHDTSQGTTSQGTVS